MVFILLKKKFPFSRYLYFKLFVGMENNLLTLIFCQITLETELNFTTNLHNFKLKYYKQSKSCCFSVPDLFAKMLTNQFLATQIRHQKTFLCYKMYFTSRLFDHIFFAQRFSQRNKQLIDIFKDQRGRLLEKDV